MLTVGDIPVEGLQNMIKGMMQLNMRKTDLNSVKDGRWLLSAEEKEPLRLSAISLVGNNMYIESAPATLAKPEQELELRRSLRRSKKSFGKNDLTLKVFGNKAKLVANVRTYENMSMLDSVLLCMFCVWHDYDATPIKSATE